MGWSNGSELAEGVWGAVKSHIPAEKKQAVAKEIVRLFEDMDCDTLDECDELMDAANGIIKRDRKRK